MQDKLDYLIYIARESNLSDERKVVELQKMFPALCVEGEGAYDKYVTDSFLTQYSYNRSLGLTVSDTAYTVGRSATLLNKLLKGEGLSIVNFVRLVNAELTARAEGKQRILRTLEDNVTTLKSTTAAIALLEKAFPTEYGREAGKHANDFDDYANDNTITDETDVIEASRRYAQMVKES